MKSLVRLGVALIALSAIAYSAHIGGGPAATPPPGPTHQAVATDIAEATASTVAGSSGDASETPGVAPTPTSGTGAWPAIGHIYQIVLENQEATSIIGSRDAPYLNSLATTYGLATNYTGIAHPSQPNYIAMFAGSTLDVTDNSMYDLTATNLADQIEASGRDWRVAAQNYPLGCFTGASAKDGPDGAGTYTRKHNPAISFTQISGDPARCARITDFAHFDPSVANYWFIEPNLCVSMHDCSIKTGDNWLKSFLPKLLTSSPFEADGLALITFDEGSSAIRGGGRVVTIVISPKAKIAFSSAAPYDHYSLLRTIEELWGMPCLLKSCGAPSLREFFP